MIAFDSSRKVSHMVMYVFRQLEIVKFGCSLNMTFITPKLGYIPIMIVRPLHILERICNSAGCLKCLLALLLILAAFCVHRCNFKILVSIINEVFVSIPKKQKTSNNVSDLMLIHQYDFPTLSLKKSMRIFLFAPSANAIHICIGNNLC